MNNAYDMTNELWEHFAALLPQLNEIGEQPILVAGGFGLLMKQSWLSLDENKSEKLIVPLDRWKDPGLRSTKDIDIVIGLDILCEWETQKAVASVLKSHSFSAVEGKENWKWANSTNQVVIDLHAPEPGKENPSLREKGGRVKPRKKKGPGENPIHGRSNAELVGHDLAPFSFTWRGVAVNLPNPVTFLLMKLTAADDYWKEAQEADKEEETREQRDQALKHARDVFRLIAMVTRGEYETASGIVDQVAQSPAYRRAAKIAANFVEAGSWVAGVVRNDWGPEDMRTMQSVLSEWFGGKS